MDILHWWQIKMVAIQLLCFIGVAGGVRFLLITRTATAKVQQTGPATTQIQRLGRQQFSQN